MFGYFSLILSVVITLIMLVPFGFAALYAFLSLKQLIIAEKEKSKLKMNNGAIALAVSLTGMILIIFLWLYIMARM
ncbi:MULTISPECIES: hypothetical protein [Niastella]|uniref:DUF4190 domain-containing protein n=1 Tax=Niastella soli TaxID=2821487 RepID=A0ABS3YQU3_9BACT|nr:hypothetical protein [Niastella soli]MBO9200272.1 hypothetical protein [Niastella soli]